MSEDKESAEAIVSEVHKKIRAAFDVFDHELNKTVDVREIGTIIRSLGCFPNEGELHDVIAEIEEEEPTGYIRFEKFLPTMTKVLMERNVGVPSPCTPSTGSPSPLSPLSPTHRVDLPGYHRVFRPIPEDLLLQAFEVLDKQKKGHLELEELTKYMTQEGEPFTQEEMEEMLSAAMDPDKNLIFYKDFVSMMTLDDPR
ncbi:dynein regulatory complex protein 8 isoform X1 [Salmo salar]|uniref:Dynein regulatory complex protein 8 isoform X1 n=1 Tax=Salmo salar TaxID=8030 RepID=A0A1S3LX46_SALSA|nr:dynein regulatory complex protein 8 isoform X1 [Salmo salar]|eukprot:XP_013995174.1 PREDICTED: EF-hand calcium-binding domain-containing protein 2 isoform X1 [Salmo salar]